MKEIKYLIVILFFFFIGCKQKANENIKINLLFETKIDITDNKAINSRIAFSDSILLIKSNQYYHSVEGISNSEIFLLKKGKRIKTNSSFEELTKKFNLIEMNFNEILYSKNNKVPENYNKNIITLDDLDKKRGFKNNIKISKNNELFQYYQNESFKKVNLKISNKESENIFTFNINGHSPTINLFDITGDKKEELFIFEIKDLYLEKEISLKIYNVKF